MSRKHLEKIAPGYGWKKVPGSVNIYVSSKYRVEASVTAHESQRNGRTQKFTVVKFRFEFFSIHFETYEDPARKPFVVLFPTNGDDGFFVEGRTEIPCGDSELVYTILVLEQMAVGEQDNE